MAKNNSSIFPNSFSYVRDVNFGMALLAIYFLLDFGAFQGIYEILSILRIPFIIAALSVLYALYLLLTAKVKLNAPVTRNFIIFCLFIIIYSQLQTVKEQNKSAYLTLVLQYLANYIIMISCVKKPSQFIFLIDVWLFGIFHSSYHAIYQGGKLWDSIWLKDENHISLICAYAVPFAFFFFMNCQSKLKKLFYLLCMALYTTSVVISASRGGFISLVTVAFLCWLAIRAKFKSLMIMIVATLTIFSFAPPKFFNEVKTLEQGTKEGTADQRIYLWGIALEMFYEHPLLGVGLSNYPLNVPKYDVEKRFTIEYYFKGKDRVAHSTPMQWLAETGIAGVIILLLLQISLYKNWKTIQIYKNKQADYSLNGHNLFLLEIISNACAITQVGFWVASLFLSLLPYPFYWCLIPFSETWKNIVINHIMSKNNGFN